MINKHERKKKYNKIRCFWILVRCDLHNDDQLIVGKKRPTGG